MLILAAAPAAARADVDLTGFWELDSFLQSCSLRKDVLACR
jgi:hypothetical protein